MRVPKEAGDGMAKVTLSFDAWKEGKVTPSTMEVPVMLQDDQEPGEDSTIANNE